MAKPTLTVTFEGEAAERLAALAEASGRTPGWFADFMIREYAAQEMAIVAEINRGLESAKRGEGIAHDDVMAEIDALISAAEEPRHKRKGRAAAR